MLRFADTSIRLYRRQDWSVAVRLRSYLMIHCKGNQGLRLGAYLNQFDAKLTLNDGQLIEFSEYGFTNDCTFEMDHMIHDFWALGVAKMESIQDGAARLQVEYRLFSFPGQGDPEHIDLVVPVLARGVHAQRWARRKSAA